MKAYDYTLTSYLPSATGGWFFDDNQRCGFLSPTIISQLKVPYYIGDKISISQDENGFTQRVLINGKLAFEAV